MPRRPKMELIRVEVPNGGEELLIRDFVPEHSLVVDFRRRRIRYTRERTPAQLVVMADYLRARRAFASDQEMAEALNVHRTRLAAWKQGNEVPNAENAQLLSHLAVVVAELSEFLDPGVVGDWLLSDSAHLEGRTPLQALREGRLAEVLQATNALEHGAYT